MSNALDCPDCGFHPFDEAEMLHHSAVTNHRKPIISNEQPPSKDLAALVVVFGCIVFLVGLTLQFGWWALLMALGALIVAVAIQRFTEE